MIAVEPATGPTDEVRGLIEALEAELSAHYAAEQRHGLQLDALFQPHIRFFLAWQDGNAVGCCGVALLDGLAELKRMFVQPAARGSGAAAALLARVEAEVKAAGYVTLWLETGDRQHAAIRFYERAGFRRCEAFGAYRAMPPGAIATSVFMTKPLR